MYYRTKDDLQEIIKLGKPERVIRLFWKESKYAEAYQQYLDSIEILYKEQYPEDEDFVEYVEVKENKVIDGNGEEQIEKEYIYKDEYYEIVDGEKRLKEEYQTLIEQGKIKPTFELFKDQYMSNENTSWKEPELDWNEYVSFVKPILLKRNNDRFEKEMSTIREKYPESERQTWYIQEQEARAYKADNSVETPFIDNIANSRGIDKDELVDKIITKADTYKAMVGNAVGNKQKIEDLIENIVSIEDIDKLDF